MANAFQCRSARRVRDTRPVIGEPDLDVLIIGAGITGIGVACMLERELPGRRWAVLESREAIGGTWDLFRYPGIRSDVDMYTFGYSFNPWRSSRGIADGTAIREYLEQTATDNGVTTRIRFGHRVVSASWSSEAGAWRVTAVRADSDETVELTARWLFSATGYFRYDHGHTPQFEGIDEFEGEVVHPQHWPERLDWTGKRVVVIGSGATAVTVVPAMAEAAAHVTMLQRSPTWMVTVPWRDPINRLLGRRLSPDRAYAIARRRSIFIQQFVWNVCKRRPELVAKALLRGVKRQLPAGYDVERHFKPDYDPWDQRLCVVPGGDLFKEIRAGRASVATDRVERFTAGGIRLESGAELEADIVVTATGLDLLAFGGVDLEVDGRRVDVGQAVTYRGMMVSGVPNFITSFPYPHVAWTLRVEVVAEHFQRILEHMDAISGTSCVPVQRDPRLPTHPFGDYTSNYVMRSRHLFPQSGDREPWMLDLNLRRDRRNLRERELDDGILAFG